MTTKHRKADAPTAAACQTRARAETRPWADLPPSEMDNRGLLHELRVCQVELELQNAALRESMAEVEAGRQRYEDLYALAPIGYLTVEPDGTIRQANPAAARLLVGRPEVALLQDRRLGVFVNDPLIATLNAFLERVFAERCRLSVEM